MSISRYFSGNDSGWVDLAAPPRAYLQTGFPDLVLSLLVPIVQLLSASLSAYSLVYDDVDVCIVVLQKMTMK